MKPYLNIGCGSTFHEAWENIDMMAQSPLVRQHDLMKGFPYDDNTFDAVYASHLLEHIPFASVNDFLRECVRVIRPDGVLRFAVPDFETMAARYLECLEKATQRDQEAVAQHEWMIIEIIDQAVRSTSGGLMKQFVMENQDAPIIHYIRSRIGQEACSIINENCRGSLIAGISFNIGQYYRKLAKIAIQLFAGALCGSKGRSAVTEGFFRSSGEVHKWIYDRVSVQQLLERHGCREVKKMDAFTSRIPLFSSYQLDTREGEVRKPDSLFMEGIKA